MEKTRDLTERTQALKTPDPVRAKSQRAKGKWLARQRMEYLLDEGSFQELDLMVQSQCADFGLSEKNLPGDGVITGFGKINGRDVCAFSQDFTVLGGALGLAHAKKICKIMDLAVENGVPVIGICDSGGARIQEGVDSLGGYAEIFYRNVQASGRVPQITAILGPCAGGAVYSPAMTDFVFMVEGSSYMFITGPEVVKAATGETTDFEKLGGAAVHSRVSGVCHFVAGSEPDCFRQIRSLLDYLPQNCFQTAPRRATRDPQTRLSPRLQSLSEGDPKKPYPVQSVVREIADEGEFLEAHKNFAPNLVTGFIRLNGRSIGVVANNSQHLSGALDIAASEKGGRFVRFCDAFNIPLLTLVDVPGYWPGLEQERGGIIRHGAQLLYAYCEATVPKVTVILRKAYGGAYDVMGSKHIRADFNFAWPSAQIAVMGPQGAVNILYAKEIRQSKDPERALGEKLKQYADHFTTPYIAAKRGYIDEVIAARQTRMKVIRAFDFLANKKTSAPEKKHGNIPL
ncbi:MAG: methylmalonyl-CoA carboxyltransferase [Elusimicrobia bacterium RIFCSPLOWO2_12_FULL_59_9]|nr:MAG: methylmalonyl-CoA carboxyltransferase [Elusimicrobia bacterium RIFCSPLOWO2_12_FULL_59_9]